MKLFNTAILFSFIFFLNCSSNDDNQVTEINNPIISSELYFPPLNSNEWETASIELLGWNTNSEQALYDLLEDTDSRSFIILKDGKIAIEWYFNNHTQNTNWRWYSAVKSLTATAIGIAQDQGFIDIDEKTSTYLGNNWSSLSQEKQDLITVKNHLTMTTGLVSEPENFINWTCTLPACLNYFEDSGTVWQYHQGAFSQLQNIITQTTGSNFKTYIKDNILDRIGITGEWEEVGFLNIFNSNARGMARFGLLALAEGTWQDTTIVNSNYFNDMVNTSQPYNLSYGYLWWLNGKESFVTTNSEFINSSIVPNAPNDMYAALGAQDQKIYVIPSLNMVVVRQGNSANEQQLASSSFDNQLWEKINTLIN